jgi:hypothetical protein
MSVGPIDPDQLMTVFLINAMSEDFSHLQSNMQAMTKEPNFSSSDIINRLQEEESVIRRRAEQGSLPTSDASALVATSPDNGNRARQKLYCSNCKRTSHNTDFCIRQNGKMAGKTIDEARAAQCAALGKPPKTGSNSAHIATESATDSTSSSTPSVSKPVPQPTPTTKGNPIMLNGTRYFPEAPTATPDAANLASLDTLLTSGDLFEYHAFTAVNNDIRTSVNWADFSCMSDAKSVDNLPLAYPSSSGLSSRDPMSQVNEIPFIMDTGATCHISSERSDFKTLRPTPPHPVKGIGNACVYAVGMGTIELTIAGGHKVILDNALFIPSSSVRLLSVLALNRSGNYTTHFDSHSCWVTRRDGSTIL